MVEKHLKICGPSCSCEVIFLLDACSQSVMSCMMGWGKGEDSNRAVPSENPT